MFSIIINNLSSAQRQISSSHNKLRSSDNSQIAKRQLNSIEEIRLQLNRISSTINTTILSASKNKIAEIDTKIRRNNEEINKMRQQPQIIQ